MYASNHRSISSAILSRLHAALCLTRQILPNLESLKEEHCKQSGPLGVTWRLGKEGLATWWRNERRLSALEAEMASGIP